MCTRHIAHKVQMGALCRESMGSFCKDSSGSGFPVLLAYELIDYFIS